jgi:hypothetical protein
MVLSLPLHNTTAVRGGARVALVNGTGSGQTWAATCDQQAHQAAVCTTPVPGPYTTDRAIRDRKPGVCVRYGACRGGERALMARTTTTSPSTLPPRVRQGADTAGRDTRGSRGFVDGVEVPFDMLATWPVDAPGWDGDDLAGQGVELLAVAEFAS